jgi:hypothetical protein
VANPPSLLDRLDAEAFAEWWSHYPRKVARKEAQKAYTQAISSGVVSHEILLSAVTAYAEAVEHKEMKFIPHAATWIRGERWGDDLECENGSGLAEPRTRGDERQDGVRAYFEASQRLLDELQGRQDGLPLDS